MSQSLSSLRNTAALLLAYAVTDLFPDALLAGGEASDIGFHYDFVFRHPVDEQALALIEERMRLLVNSHLSINILEMVCQNAKSLFTHHHQPLIAENAASSSNSIIRIARIGEFYDLCPGKVFDNFNQIRSLKLLKADKLLINFSIRGKTEAVRIEGVICEDNSSLKKFLRKIHAAQKCDHRILGSEMNLFSLQEELGPGYWLWHPKGVRLRQLLLDWWRGEHCAQHYQFLSTPNSLGKEFLKRAGVASAYVSTMPEFSLENTDYALRSSLGPSHAFIFKMNQYHERELPIRYAESFELFDPLKRKELLGLFRTRIYSSDTAHIFCSPDQIFDEMISSLHFIDKFIKMSTLEHRWYLVLQGKKFAGERYQWEETVDLMARAMQANGLSYSEEHMKAFDGPRLEVRFLDSLGREWCGPALKVDLNLPQRMGIRYRSSGDKLYTPIMLSRTTFGSLERLIALLVEKFSGMLPLWMAPEQVRVLPVGEQYLSYAKTILSKLEDEGIRVGLDPKNERLENKIKSVERERVPYTVIVGECEQKSGVINVRPHSRLAQKQEMPLEQFLMSLREE